MRNLLRQLQGEDEPPRRAIDPAANRRRRWRRVESRIHFHRVERSRVDSEEIRWSRACRIEWSDPGVVIPALRADMDLRSHEVQSGAADRRCQALRHR